MHHKLRTRNEGTNEFTSTGQPGKFGLDDHLVYLGNGPAGPFHELAELASSLCWTTDGFVTLKGANGMYLRGVSGRFRQVLGDQLVRVPLEHSFCPFTLLQDRVLEVEDASLDPRFRNMPVVTAGPLVRFYAGAAFADPGGRRIGVVCVCDTIPRRLKDWQRQALTLVAHQASAQVALRLFETGASWN